MAMSATISLSASTVLINQKVTATLTVSNSSGTDVNLTSVVPKCIMTGSNSEDPAPCLLGTVPLSNGVSVVVPASSSATFRFDCIFYGPSTGPTGSGLGTFSVGANLLSSDGSSFSPTAATITANPLPQPNVQSYTLSLLTVASSSIASGATETVTLTAVSPYNVPLSTGGLTVVFATSGSGTSSGTLSATTDNGDGTYTATFTATTSGTAKSITASMNGRSITSTLPTITVTPGVASPVTSLITVASATVAELGTDLITLTAKDAAGNLCGVGGRTVAFTNDGGTSVGSIGATTDVGNGTYTAVYTATTAGTANTINATINTVAVTSSPIPTITVT